MTLRDEFIFSINGKRFYDIKDLDYFDDILIQDDKRFHKILSDESYEFWDKARVIVSAYVQKHHRFEKEPEPVLISKMPIADIRKKFG